MSRWFRVYVVVDATERKGNARDVERTPGRGSAIPKIATEQHPNNSKNRLREQKPIARAKLIAAVAA
jgi:hypothetical protein